MSYHDNHPTDPEKQAARHAREEALIPPEWLVERVANAVLARDYPNTSAQARAVLAEIAKHGKLVAREPSQNMLNAAVGKHSFWYAAAAAWDAAPQWPEGKK